MRLQIVAVRAVVFGLLLSPVLCPVKAQWLSYPTAGVPRTPDGKPNLGAACPRTADGKPDLSDLWIMQTKRPGNADFPGCDPVLRRSRKITHLCSVRVTHLKNRILV